MAKRKDGLERRTALLDAATRIFADKGYKGTTISDISLAAKANIASINYYFGSKESLYAEVWKNAFHKAQITFPLEGDSTPQDPPEKRLRHVISSLLHRVLDKRLGSAGQILLMELTDPTESIDFVKQNAITPTRQKVRTLIRELIGSRATDESIAFCSMSIIHQCFGFGFRKGKIPVIFQGVDQMQLLDSLVDHITLFSLGGIQAVRNSLVERPIGMENQA
jgi:AcrR family transcriptional regulator